MPLSWLWDAETTADFQCMCGVTRVAVVHESPNNSDTGSGEHVRVAGENGDVLKEVYEIQNGAAPNGKESASNGTCHTNNGVNGNGCRQSSSFPTKTTDIATADAMAHNSGPTCKVVHRYPLLRFIFWMASTVGEEEFFIAFLPMLFWNFDFFVGRRVILMWFITMYLGTALKDFIRSERPSNRVVIREVDDEHSREYGLPSTHTTSGGIITATLLYVTYMRYEFSLLPAVLIAIPLVLSMGASRLYSGHHLLIDVLAAFGLVIVMTVLGFFFLEYLDSVYMHPTLLGPSLAMLTAAFCIYIYPHPPVIRSSSKDMPIIIAVFVGFYVGLWASIAANPKDDRHLEPFALHKPDQQEIIGGVMRYITGVFFLLVVRAMLKWSSLKFFSRFADPSKGPAKEQLSVVICYRLVTYGGTAAICIALSPHYFQLLGVPCQAA